ncbi:conserved hypothetical protein [Candidatus Liberibacter solanacearum]
MFLNEAILGVESYFLCKKRGVRIFLRIIPSNSSKNYTQKEKIKYLHKIV